MILSTATLTGVTEAPSIIEDIDFECESDSTSFPLADKLRLINKWMLRIGLWIWRSQGDWKFDDLNATTLPRATQSLVADQRDYSMPTGILSIEKVQVKNSSGDWINLEHKDLSEYIYEDPDNGPSGTPQFYDLEGYSIILDPAPATGSVTLTAGLRVFLSRQITKFDNTDAASSPGFEEQFHDMIVKGVSYDYCRAHSISDKLVPLRTDIAELKQELNEFYGTRNRTDHPKLRRREQSYE